MKKFTSDVAVIGGGPAGLMAAITAADRGKSVIIVERNSSCGKKLLITGKGRCNVTNNCSCDEVMTNIPRNPRFMFSSLEAFSPIDVMNWFENRGVRLKTERGNRVFPESDKSNDILQALLKTAKSAGVQIINGRAVDILAEDNSVLGVKGEDFEVKTAGVVLATGGKSYPLTGSTGDGYKMASRLGHSIVEAKPSLVPLEENGDDCVKMQGLALKNISVKLINQKGKAVFSDFGELLFTHFGVSGPVVLSASAHMKEKDTYKLRLDLKPALDEKTLDARILRDFEKYQNRDFSNSLSDLLPRLLIPVIIERSGIPSDTKVNSITKAQRRTLLEAIKFFDIEILGKRPIEEAIVTSGGVKTGEINPATMESKLISGLYFAGEIIDVDAYTGGFNLQVAWSTAHAAGVAV
ncbi:MAG: NAD(P)/FAD-dependent oxidoreductase [Ruminococcaceae bacterium]|nr:NAD(P)/FAD-dependent oxidoreductase [Oscillospiraceae bacterium]